MAYRNYTAGSTGFLVAKDGTGDFTTIGAALAAATSGTTIFVKESATAYTENLTLKGGVNIASYSGDFQSANVSIIGKASKSVAGDVSITGIYLQTNADFIISNDAAGHINLIDCYLQAQDHTLISMSAGGTNLYNCTIAYITTGITFAATTGGILELYYCREFNGGLTTTSSTYADSTITYFYCTIVTPCTTSGTTALNCRYTNMPLSNITGLTLGGSGAHNIYESTFVSGTATAIVVNTVINMTGGMVSSSNTNAISGSGTLNYGGIVFAGSSHTISTVTQNPVAWTVPQGGTGLTSTTVNQILYSSGTNVIAGLATVNNGVLITSASGVPSILADGTTGQVFTATTGAPPGWAALPYTPMPFVDVSGTSQAMAVNTGYISDNGSLVTLTLPTTAAIGDTIVLHGKGAGGWKITYTTSQQIQVGSSASTVTTGNIASTNQWDAITMTCVTANNIWAVRGLQGNITVA